MNHIAKPYAPEVYYIQSQDGIVRVYKDESGGNEGVVSGLVESVHALVQVVLKQHEVNHNEASYGRSEPENEQQLKIQKYATHLGNEMLVTNLDSKSLQQR